MGRKYLFLMCLLSIGLQAQTVNWTRVSGTTIENTSTELGASQKPGSRRDAAEWIDSNGDIWIFGGYGWDNSGTFGYLGDLWKFTTSSSTWTLIGGSTSANPAGTNGTKGVPSIANIPGGRYDACTFTDPSTGIFYLFGGLGKGNTSTTSSLNDLWSFNPNTLEWTWLSGESYAGIIYGVYPNKGETSPTAVPGARSAGATWANDTAIWLLGGRGYAKNGTALSNLNDLWMYKPSTNQWYWMSGSDSPYPIGSYGTITIPSVSNSPGGRSLATFWQDNDGYLWLFGGWGYYTSTTNRDLNDLWKYNPATNEWTWMNGTVSQIGVYGILGEESPSNVIGSRRSASAWVNSNGEAYIFGGYAYTSSSPIQIRRRNDLWRYNPTSNLWTWTGGTDLVENPGDSGTINITASTNLPAGISSSSLVYDKNNDVGYLLFGQTSNGQTETTWKFEANKTTWTSTGWSNGLPNADVSVTIGSNNPVGTFSSYHVTIDSGYSLTLGASDTVYITSYLNNNGSGISGSGTIVFDANNGTSSISGDAVSHSGVIYVESGTTLYTNGLLTLSASSSSDYGMLLGDGCVEGAITAEAWLSLNGGTNDGRYFHLGSPITNSVYSDYNEDGNSIVSANTSQGSCWDWDADNAEWAPCGNGNLNSGTTPGNGVAIYAGSASGVNYLRDNAGTISLSGNVSCSDVSAPLGYNSGTKSSVTFVGGSNINVTEGWNLLANPFPAIYDWDGQVFGNGLGTAIYTWNGSNYVSYNQGAGAGSRYISPFQAFFFQKRNSNGATSINFARSQRTSTPSPALLKSNPHEGVLMVVYSNDSTRIDQLYLGVEHDASIDYDDQYDAMKLLNAEGVPNLFAQFDSIPMSICRVNTNFNSLFPVYLNSEVDKELYTIEALNNTLQNVSTVELKDLKTGTTVDLLTQSYSFVHDMSWTSNRFEVRFKSSISVEELTQEIKRIIPVEVDREIRLLNAEESHVEVRILSINGSVVDAFNTADRVSTQVSIPGVYVVQLISENQTSVAHKVLIP